MFGLSFGVYISNKVGPEAVGVFQLVMSVYLFFVTLATSGINLATTRVVSEELAVGRIDGIRRAMKLCVLYSFLLGCFAGGILFAFSQMIASTWLHGKVSYVPLCVLSCCLPFLSVSSSLIRLF